MKEYEYSLINIIKIMFPSFVIHKSCEIDVTIRSADPLSYVDLKMWSQQAIQRKNAITCCNPFRTKVLSLLFQTLTFYYLRFPFMNDKREAVISK
jgi:hypothetical protein